MSSSPLGHRVTGVTRSQRGRRLLEGLGARAVDADVFDQAALTRAFAGADAVVNLLTHIPPPTMAAPGAWDENDRLRSKPPRRSRGAAQAAGAERLVQESLAFLYADGGDAWLDEDAPGRRAADRDRARRRGQRHASCSRATTVVLRFGLFIGPDSGPDAVGRRGCARGRSRRTSGRATRTCRRLARRRRRGGRGRARRAGGDLQRGRRGAADQRRDRRGARRRRRARRLRPALDELPPGREPVARSQRVSSRRLREATGWAPRVRAGTDGWRPDRGGTRAA